MTATTAYWNPNGLWAGEDVFVIGGGPSLKGFDFSLLKGRKSIGCNAAFRLGSEVCPVCFFSDFSFFIENYEELRDFSGILVTHSASMTARPESWVQHMLRYAQGLHTDGLGFGGNSGCSALNLALVMGAARVFLLGIDCDDTATEHHWHERGKKQKAGLFPKFLGGFHKMAMDLPVVFPQAQVYNLNNCSKLRAFPFMEPSRIFGADSPARGVNSHV